MTVGSSDSYVQAQINARRSPSVIKLRLLNFRSVYQQGLVVAVEGDDDKIVYSHWIAREAPDISYEFFVCNGKRSIRQLRNLLSSDRADAAKDVVFIVDRDFDDLRGFESTEGVYMLDCYSMENYIVDSIVVNASIKVAFPGDTDPINRASLCAIFEEDYKSFLRASAEMNKRIFVGRKMNLDIDEYIPKAISHIASINVGDVRPVACDCVDLIPFSRDLDASHISELEREFDKLDPAPRYRGKFAFKFLIVWLECLAKEFRDPRKGIFAQPYTGTGKIKIQELSLGPMAARSRTPNGLLSFVQTAALACT